MLSPIFPPPRRAPRLLLTTAPPSQPTGVEKSNRQTVVSGLPRRGDRDPGRRSDRLDRIAHLVASPPHRERAMRIRCALLALGNRSNIHTGVSCAAAAAVDRVVLASQDQLLRPTS
jgi:hypothetical protein